MIDRDALRSLIRDVIEAEVGRSRQEGPATTSSDSGHAIRVENDSDLKLFARTVLSLAENKGERDRILSGAYPFQLSGAGAPVAMSAPSRLDHGVVTESTLVKLPKGTKVLELGPGVVVTPLARERARALGIKLEMRRA